MNILQSMFDASDPEGLGGGSLRARSFLAPAIREIDRLETSQPALFRDLAYRMAGIQINMGMTRESLDLIRRANRIGGAQSDENTLLEIRVRIIAGENALARNLIETSRTRLGTRAEFIAEDAHLLYLEKNYKQAIALLELLLEREGGPSESVVRDRVYRYLAEVYREADRLENAITALDRQIREQSERIGRDHPSTAITFLRRQEPLIQMGQAAAAERELVLMKPLLERHYDHESSIFGLHYTLVGSAANALQKSEEALASFRQALAINRKVLGEDHENTLRSHMNIALIIIYGGGDRREAYPHFASAIAGFEKNMKATGSLVGFARLEAAKGHYWDNHADAAKGMLTPPHALDYFEQMTESNRSLYLAGLFYGFGRQDCSQGWQVHAQRQPESERMARTLMCRYDPEAKHVPVD